MRAPKLYETTRSREMMQEFRGYNHNLRIGENEFYDMENLTGDYYPVLSSRNKRGRVKKIGQCNGMLAKKELAYVDGNVLHYGQNTMQLDESVNGERQLISMGAYIIVFPDMMYANTADWEDQGYFGRSSFFYHIDQINNLKINLCNEQGDDISVTYIKPPVNRGYCAGYNADILLGSAVCHQFNIAIHVGECMVDIPSIPEDIDPGEENFNLSYFDMKIGDTSIISSPYDSLSMSMQGGTIIFLGKKEGETTITYSYKNAIYAEQTVCVKNIDCAKNGEYCLDLTPLPSNPPVLSVYMEAKKCWENVPIFTKISIFGSFSENLSKLVSPVIIEDSYVFDGISIGSMLYGNTEERKLFQLTAIGDDYLVVSGAPNFGMSFDTSKYMGVLDYFYPLNIAKNVEATISVLHDVPVMDFLIESENRLWGCRYGKNAKGNFVNEIYASAQANFFTWNCFDTVATDSYVASVGSDGPFTGAINYRNHPIFFKENCYHTVYGSYPQNYQIVTETGTGVQSGSAKSLCVISGVLYYKAPDGVYRLDGASYDKISESLGFERYLDADGEAIDGKYYLAMTADDSTRVLFVYDTTKGLWHKENATDMAFFAPHKGDLWFCDGEWLCTIKGTQGTPEERDVEWFAETGVIGFSSPDCQYIGKLQVRLTLPAGSYVNFYIEYDSDQYWDFVGGIKGTSLMSFTLPIVPRRCDHFKLRISGVGECKIFSIAKIMEDGGDA